MSNCNLTAIHTSPQTDDDKSFFNDVLSEFLLSHKDKYPCQDSEKLREKLSTVIAKKYSIASQQENRSAWIEEIVKALLDIICEEQEESNKNIDVSGFLQGTTWKGYSLLPYQVIRSALFSVNKHYRDTDGNIRQYILDKNGNAPIVACHGNYEIRYLGPQINQSDLDVLIGCLELAKSKGEKNKLEGTLYALCIAMGKAPGKKYYDWLENSLKRISYGKIDIRTTDGRNVFIDSFIHGFKRIDNIVSFQFSPHLIKLFEEGATQLPLQQRLSLNSDLDKWLYGYFNSHDDTKSKPVKVETLHAWSGSTLSLKHFKTKLKESIKRLNDQTNINLTFTDNKCTLVQCKKRKVSNLLTA